MYSGCVTFGAIFGGLVQRFCLHKFGRKHCFSFANVIATISGILVLVPSMYTLMIGRIGQGVVVGMMSGIVPIMVKEYVPISLSGTLGAIYNLAMISGFLVAFSLPIWFEGFMAVEQATLLVFGLTLLTTLLQQVLLMFVFTNETPKYLISKGREEEAKQLIN